MSIVDGINEFAVVPTTTLLGSSKGSLATSVLTTAIPRG